MKIDSFQNMGKTVFTDQIIIIPIPPFSFDLSARIFSEGDPQIRKYENGKFWQIVRIRDKLFLIRIWSIGTDDKPKLLAELTSASEIAEDDRAKAKEIITELFNLDFDLNPFYKEVKSDKIMACVTKKLWGLKSPTTQTVFEALVDSAIEQQISLRVANSIEIRLIKTFGESMEVGNVKFYSYPTSQKLASVDTEKIRLCGLTRRKAEYLKEISKLVTSRQLDLDELKQRDNVEEIIKKLDSVMGIGVWTAELAMVRGMKKLEAMPADDIGLRRIISHYYNDNTRISSIEARRIAMKWGRWKGLAAYYLVVADIMDLKI
jgi:DNA-3-methyladenine glycosylase II